MHLIYIGVVLVDLLQVRGSIPLQWEQIVDLTYKPKFELLKSEEAVSGCFIIVFLEFPSYILL